MSDVTKALEAVGALIGERSKYEGWIAALATKSDVPAHVLEKVRADYSGRLSGVLSGFSAHMPALQTALADFQSRDSSLSAQEKACRDEHAEGELRHMVGEYDNEQWDQVRVGHEALLSRLASERQSVAAELAEVQRSLAATSDAGHRARAMGEKAAPSSASRDEAPTPAVAAAIAESRSTPPAAPAAPEPIVAAAPVAAPQPIAEPTDRRPVAEDLGFLRSAPRTTPRDNGGTEAVAQSTGSAGRAADAPALRIVPDSPAPAQTPRSVATAAGAIDAAKTLRCAECGTMNYASEWYCERCGGELAVL
jgi:hypothetical protein